MTEATTQAATSPPPNAGFLLGMLAAPGKAIAVYQVNDFLTRDSTSNYAPPTDNATDIGRSGRRIKQLWAGTATINTSDERLKDLIEDTPDTILDAWGDVKWRRFKMRDAMATKGDAARWHVGLIAQQIHAAFAARGLDAFELGLLCFDQLAEEHGKAGDRWSLRYEECLALEAAWQRRRGDRLEAAIAALQDRLATAGIA